MELVVISHLLFSRQIKYAWEDKFKSIVSLYKYTSDMGEDPDKRGLVYPSFDTANYTAALAGIEYTTIGLTEGDEWMNLETAQKVDVALKAAPKPVLFYDENAFASTFLLLFYLVRDTHMNGADADVQVTVDDMMATGAYLGFDFSRPEHLSLYKDVTGELITDRNVRPNVSSSNNFIDKKTCTNGNHLVHHKIG